MLALQWWRKRELRAIGGSWLWRSLGWYEHWALGNTALHPNGSLDVAQCERTAFNGSNFRPVGGSGEVCRSDTNNKQHFPYWWHVIKRMNAGGKEGFLFVCIYTCTLANVHVRFLYVNWIDQTLEDKMLREGERVWGGYLSISIAMVGTIFNLLTIIVVSIDYLYDPPCMQHLWHFLMSTRREQ